MQKYFDNVTRTNGDAVAGARVTVTSTATGVLATIYSDNGVTTTANPITCDNNGYFEFYAANGLYDLEITGSLALPLTISDVQLSDVILQDASANLMGWALSQSFRLVSATRNSDEAITTASIVWPDGATGVFTGTVLSTAFPGAIDAWSATYLGTTTKTITQPTVTRDSSGAVTVQPAITIV